MQHATTIYTIERLRKSSIATKACLKTRVHIIGACTHSSDDGCNECAKAIFGEAIAEEGALSEAEHEKLVSALVHCLSCSGDVSRPSIYY